MSNQKKFMVYFIILSTMAGAVIFLGSHWLRDYVGLFFYILYEAPLVFVLIYFVLFSIGDLCLYIGSKKNSEPLKWIAAIFFSLILANLAQIIAIHGVFLTVGAWRRIEIMKGQARCNDIIQPRLEQYRRKHGKYPLRLYEITTSNGAPLIPKFNPNYDSDGKRYSLCFDFQIFTESRYIYYGPGGKWEHQKNDWCDCQIAPDCP
jgi:hypothetical protein